MLTRSYKNRIATLSVDELFLSRWSPRSFDTDFVITEQQLLTVFEAARWSWSSNNLQPWRFIYGYRGNATFQKILAGLDEYNAIWAKNASVLVLILTQIEGEKGPNYSALFDTGAAAMSMSLQLQLLELSDRHMGGINRDLLRESFQIPEKFAIHCAVAMGKQDTANNLDEFNQPRETPSDRLLVSELAKTHFDF